MDSQALFSSPPRRAPATFDLGRVSRSGGATGRMRPPVHRHLSSTARAARMNEQPWRKRFREQCMDRLSRARDESFMMRRQLAGMAKDRSEADTSMQLDAEPAVLSEDEIGSIIQQEWARFRAEMERQSLECGVLDAGIVDEIEEDFDMADEQDCQMRELAEWEEYEDQLLEDEMIEAALLEADTFLGDGTAAHRGA
ncbi:hypothetical protein GGF46_004669 [Coemansia sp. RSA 552]|nr:hypothetical protein GGF46_004669 [Coemansia sp. RSA 552]